VKRQGRRRHINKLNLFFTSGNYWQDATHRREFFDKLASKKGFDPLIPDNWYSLSKETIINEKVSLKRVFLCIYFFLLEVWRGCDIPSRRQHCESATGFISGNWIKG
jgi:hypothetical protein